MTRSFAAGLTVIVATAGVTSAHNWKGKGPDEPTPLVVGHRGASAYLPEHTLAAYQLAIDRGADYIEPDLVSTKDGVLFARHEVNIAGTTDVGAHPEFAGRFTTKTVDGIAEHGWFADDFTLAEIRTLRATQRVAFRAQQYNGLYEIPTFSEVIELAKRARREKGREVGVYPETKHPSYHRSRGLALEPKLLVVLRAHGWDRRSAPVFIQSFEVSNLKQLSRQTDVRLVQLVDGYDTLPDGSIDVDRVNVRLLSDYGEQPTQEFLEFFCLGIDGVFADSPDTAVASRILFRQASKASCRPFLR